MNDLLTFQILQNVIRSSYCIRSSRESIRFVKRLEKMEKGVLDSNTSAVETDYPIGEKQLAFSKMPIWPVI